MHDHPALVFTALLIFVFGLFSKLSERSPVTAPMVFVAMGILVSPLGLNLFALQAGSGLVSVITELTLILILFIDASLIDPKAFFQDKSVPARLLGIGLPLTMCLGILVGWLIFPDINIWLIAIMALSLSPTDAALGQAVIKSKNIPERVRRWVSIESGLNDGIVLPFLLVCIAGLTAESAGPGVKYWLVYMLQQLALGALIGGLIGWLGGLLVDKATTKGWMNSTFQRLSAGSLALLCFVGAEFFHGNGFIAAFFGGLMLGTKTPEIRKRLQEYGEAEGQQLALLVFLGFALLMVPKALPFWDFKAFLYAFLSLTLIRMGPVMLSLAGLRLGLSTLGFIGWFGPRGIASVLYLLIVVGKTGVEGYERPFAVIVLTVLLSVFAHGLSAVPLANRFGE